MFRIVSAYFIDDGFYLLMRRKMLGMMWGGSPPIMILCWKEIGGVSTSCHFVRCMSHLWCPILLKHYTTLIFFLVIVLERWIEFCQPPLNASIWITNLIFPYQNVFLINTQVGLSRPFHYNIVLEHYNLIDFSTLHWRVCLLMLARILAAI